MDKKLEIESSIEKDCTINDEKLLEEFDVLQNEDYQSKENDIDILINHLKKLLDNSYVAGKYDRNLLNL